MKTPWDDPNVQDALKEGRRPSDIWTLCCGKCGQRSYWNQGSHFTCSWCEWCISGDDFDGFLECDPAITLEEYAESQLDFDMP